MKGLLIKDFKLLKVQKKFLFAHFMHCNRYGDFYQ